MGSAAVAKATVALSAVLTAALASGCTGGSSDAGPRSSAPSSPGAVAASESPDTLGEDATASLQGSATITLGNSKPVTVTAGRGQPVTLEIAPSGATTIALAMQAGSSALFSLSGPARTGAAVRTDQVTILLAAAGVLVDSSAGNPCQASYAVVSETKVSGTVRCQTLSGNQKVPVTVRFTAS